MLLQSNKFRERTLAQPFGARREWGSERESWGGGVNGAQLLGLPC